MKKLCNLYIIMGLVCRMLCVMRSTTISDWLCYRDNQYNTVFRLLQWLRIECEFAYNKRLLKLVRSLKYQDSEDITLHIYHIKKTFNYSNPGWIQACLGSTVSELTREMEDVILSSNRQGCFRYFILHVNALLSTRFGGYLLGIRWMDYFCNTHA